MPINEWWSGDPSERYWLEITNRDNLGENLIAPQQNDAGREEWSYALVNYVRPGDIVLHWTKLGQRSIFGYSRVVTEPFQSSLEWQSRGSYGRTRPPSREEDAWEASLEGYTELRSPATQDVLRALEPRIRTVRDELVDEHGSPIYFPFAISDLRPLRASQAYLTKFPARLVELIPGLREVRQLAAAEPGEEVSRSARQRTKDRTGRRASGYGREHDAERRRAIERYAVECVMNHYKDAGYDVEDVGDRRPWDITATKGERELHLEVKGSTVERDAIDVTEGEVRHAEDLETTLIVIDRIEMDSQLRCRGGRWRHWPKWSPDRELLAPTAYRHVLVGGVSAASSLDELAKASGPDAQFPQSEIGVAW